MTTICRLLSIAVFGLLLSPIAAPAQTPSPSPEQLARWLVRFPEADANGDGRLTVEEATAYRQAATRMRQRGKKTNGSRRGGPKLEFDPGWEDSQFPAHAVSHRTPAEILAIYQQRPTARSGPANAAAMSFPKPTDGGLRVVGVGHSFMAPGYRTLPLICAAAGFKQPLCLHTGGGVTGSARYKWEQENGIFEFDGKPQPKLLAAIANADWEAMTWGGYYDDRPEFYTCWIEFCTQYHPDMKFYLSDTWPQLDQIQKLFDRTQNPDSEDFFTESVLDRLAHAKRKQFQSIVTAARSRTTPNVFIIPTNDAVTHAAKLFMDQQLPGVQGLHRAIGGHDRSIWRDPIGHLGPGFDRLEGYVFYATLYGKSPELIQQPIDFVDPTDYPNAELDRIFRKIAWQAVVQHPLSGVTDDDHNGIADRLE